MRLRHLVFLLVLPAVAGAAPGVPDDLLRLPEADVVILGEVHDNPLHHIHQKRAVAALRPAAVVYEMLTPAQAAAGAGIDRENRAALAEAFGWSASGWPDFDMYHPILLAARDAAVVGGGLEREAVRRAMREGAAAVIGTDAARFGLDRPLDPEDQARRERAQQVAHCNALPEAMLPGMVLAQRLRDAVLARAALEALGRHGGPVVVIAGTGHARRDEGVPRKLAHAAPGLRVLGVGQLEADPGVDAPFDLWIVTEAAERPDPCAVFARPAGP